MLFIFIKWLLILFCSTILGEIVYSKIFRFRNQNVFYSFFLGIFSLVLMANFLHFFVPLKFYYFSFLFILLSIYTLKNQKYISKKYGQDLIIKNKWFTFLFYFSFFYILFLSAHQSIAADDGGYYMPYIKWIQSYKIIFGLGNLHDRFAFNSNYHVLDAFLNFNTFLGYSANQLNGLFYVILNYYLIINIIKSNNNYFKTTLIFLLVFINWPHPYLVYNIVSPAPDFVVFLISIFIFTELYKKWQNELKSDNNGEIVILFLLTCMLITFKLSMIPLALLSFYLLLKLYKEKSKRTFYLSLIFSISLFIMWCASNYVLSGYFIYPINISFGNPDWKLPQSILENQKFGIKNLAFKLGSDRGIDINGKGVFDKYKIWFSNNLRIHEQLMLILYFMGLFLIIFNIKKVKNEFKFLLLIYTIAFVFWLYSAPDPRFGYIWIFPIIAFGFSFLFPKINFKFKIGLGIFVIICLQLSSFYLYYHIKTKKELENKAVILQPNNLKRIFLLPEYQYLVNTQKVRIDNNFVYELYKKENGVWDNPLPTTEYIFPGLKIRNENIKNGFEISK